MAPARFRSRIHFVAKRAGPTPMGLPPTQRERPPLLRRAGYLASEGSGVTVTGSAGVACSVCQAAS
ncbi:hypothetical protein GCM10022220_48450 [Actinocatenispora rupis]|uniref:Uncharacterized protein n=1 Tax=Actinocatenispora rupis TaxID=519421 RepID=A0A8J3J5K4_9ACTN|nr:hypothetical protein Aru02nite_32660 [Actinocatenispora rupis]